MLNLNKLLIFVNLNKLLIFVILIKFKIFNKKKNLTALQNNSLNILKTTDLFRNKFVENYSSNNDERAKTLWF